MKERKNYIAPVQVHQAKWAIPLLVAVIYLIMGLVVDGPSIPQGLIKIYSTPSQLLTDYYAVGGIGAALWNSAFIIFTCLLLIRFSGSKFTGTVIAGVILCSGVAFFGLNLFNFLPLIIGFYLYSKLEQIPFRSLMLQIFTASGLAPLVSVIAFALDLELYISIPLGYLAGIVVAFFIPKVSSMFLKVHDGYNLYNVGFTGGVIAMIIVAVIRYFGFEVEPVNILSNIRFTRLIYVFIAVYILFLIIGVFSDRNAFKKYPDLLSNSGQLIADFDTIYGTGPTMLNMAIMGFICLAYIYLTGAPLNGPTAGAAFAVAGFGAMGKHPRNTLPIMFGVFLTTLINPEYQSTTSATLTAFFGTSLAPIAGEFGVIAGIIAGFLHSILVGTLTYAHGGVDLFNNGFSAGFIAALMLPILRYIRERRGGKN